MVNLTILTLICAIIFAFISCVEAALDGGGEGRGLQFFFCLFFSYLGVVGVRGDPPGGGGPGVDRTDGSRYAGHC